MRSEFTKEGILNKLDYVQKIDEVTNLTIYRLYLPKETNDIIGYHLYLTTYQKHWVRDVEGWTNTFLKSTYTFEKCMRLLKEEYSKITSKK